MNCNICVHSNVAWCMVVLGYDSVGSHYSFINSLILILPSTSCTPKFCFHVLLTSVKHYASRNGRLPACRMLIEKGASVNVQTLGGATPLHRAAYAGHMDIIRLLLGNKADPRLTDSDGKTALHKVCMYWILTPRALKWDSVLYMAGIRRKTCWGCSTPVAARSRTEQH
jgi:hypothetical protein